MTLAGRLDRFLFAPVSPRRLTAFRAAFAGFLAAAFWPRGFEPIAGIRAHPPLASLYDAVVLTPAYWAGVLALLMLFGLGRWARITGPALLLALAPLGLLEQMRISRQVLLFCLLAICLASLRPADDAALIPIWPIRLMQIQLSALYAWNALAKLTPSFLSGEILASMSLYLPNFLVDLSGGGLAIGGWMLPLWLCAAGTAAIEGFLAAGLWFHRTRWPAAASGVAFHLALRHVVRIGFLDWTSLFLYLVFLLRWEQVGDASVRYSSGRR